ncbi:MAG: hypothetical protein HC893_15465 [Chloroflexaceae bacterium]|nr:hypothetical protein [Chloroflexaceae bacterium]
MQQRTMAEQTAQQEPQVQTVVVTAEIEPLIATVEVTSTPAPAAAEGAATEADTSAEVSTFGPDYTGPFSTPHPILSNLQVRRAIAHCTNRLELIESVYPYLEDGQKEGLLINTFLTSDHWAYPGRCKYYALPLRAGAGQCAAGRGGLDPGSSRRGARQ